VMVITNDDSLSAREEEVLKLMCSGMGAAGIAAKLSLSRKTVASFRYRLGEKTRCTSSAQLGVWAVKHGYVAE
jgi:two-component system, NarL family, invasion response regulator UvrY